MNGLSIAAAIVLTKKNLGVLTVEQEVTRHSPRDDCVDECIAVRQSDEMPVIQAHHREFPFMRCAFVITSSSLAFFIVLEKHLDVGLDTAHGASVIIDQVVPLLELCRRVAVQCQAMLNQWGVKIV